MTFVEEETSEEDFERSMGHRENEVGKEEWPVSKVSMES